MAENHSSQVVCPIGEVTLGASIKPGISFEDYEEQWDALAHFAALIEEDALRPDGNAVTGLVKIQEAGEGVLEVHAGLHGQTILNFRVKKYPQHSLWTTYQNSSYTCQEGGC